MTYNTRHSTSGINLPNLLTPSLAAIGMVVLLSGFTVTKVEFNSMDVPPSKFKIRLAKQKGLPAPEGAPGLPVKATLTKPEGKGPFPAIVMFPNGGGWPDTPRHWRERFNAWGYVTLEVGDENKVPDYMEPPSLVLDAIGALKYLQEIPYVDSNRVVVMGWDQGAETALWAIDASGWAGKHKDRFVAAVAIYPPCGFSTAGQFFSPALIISAELDDSAKPSDCERLVKSVPLDLNVPILKIIPGAYHWFDMPRRPSQLDDMTYTQTFDMTYEYNAKATEAAANHVRSFLEVNF
jgi:dienelactone hydrolase